MRLRVVIVEDDPLQREALSVLLERLPFDVVVVGFVDSVDEATDLIYDVMPDLVFLDIQLNHAIRNENGLELLKRVYKHQQVPYMVVITDHFTKYSEEIAFKRAKFIGKEIYYISKPYDVGQIEDVLKDVIKKICSGLNRLFSVKVSRGDVHLIACHDIISLSRSEDKHSRILFFQDGNVCELDYPGEFTSEVEKLKDLNGFVYARKALVFNVYRINNLIKRSGELWVSFSDVNGEKGVQKISENYRKEWQLKFNIKRY